MNNPILNLAMTMISNNPQIANNPQAKSMIEVIQSGDAERGQQIAENLCNTYGVSKEDAIKQAKSFFKIQ